MKNQKSAFNLLLKLSCILMLFNTGCKKDDDKQDPIKKLSELTTTQVSSVTQVSVITGGNISSDGGSTVTSRGVCWSLSLNPTTANSKTNDGTGIGSFTSNITGLTANTVYYVRAYASNESGTAYGQQLSFTTLVSSNVPSYVPVNGLIGWWDFTGNANDESGNGNNGVVNGALPTSDRFGSPGNAYSFNGTSDYIEVADSPALRLDNTDFTFSFWVNINTYSSSATAFIVKRAVGNLNGWMLFGNSTFNNRMEFKTSQGMDPSVLSDSTLSVNGWHHVVIVYHQSTSLDFYFNGVLSSSHSITNLNFNPNSNAVMRFGHDTSNPPGNYFFNGTMDDIGMWSRALSVPEISNLYF